MPNLKGEITRRPGYTRQDVEDARRQQSYAPPTKRTKKIAEAGRDVNKQLLGITDALLRDEDADAPMDR